MKSMILAIALFAAQSIFAQTKADDITGVWLAGTRDLAKIQIYKQGDKYFGKIVWLENPNENGQPKTDKNNPDKNKKSQPILGLVLLRDFEFDKDEWEDGKIYDPESGKTYSCVMSLQNANSLKVRGYVGVSLLGRTEVWKRSSL